MDIKIKINVDELNIKLPLYLRGREDLDQSILIPNKMKSKIEIIKYKVKLIFRYYLFYGKRKRNYFLDLIKVISYLTLAVVGYLILTRVIIEELIRNHTRPLNSPRYFVDSSRPLSLEVYGSYVLTILSLAIVCFLPLINSLNKITEAFALRRNIKNQITRPITNKYTVNKDKGMLRSIILSENNSYYNDLSWLFGKTWIEKNCWSVIKIAIIGTLLISILDAANEGNSGVTIIIILIVYAPIALVWGFLIVIPNLIYVRNYKKLRDYLKVKVKIVSNDIYKRKLEGEPIVSYWNEIRINLMQVFIALLPILIDIIAI